MNNDLISIQAALYELHLLSIEALKKHRFDYDALITICSKKLKNLPSVQSEQKTGRWIYMKDCEDWFCSNCKDIFMLLEGTPKDNDYNYCPNCGAKMESDNNDN